MRIAVLDLGSTSFRLVVVDADDGGGITQRSKERAALNLGLIAGRKGRIPEPHAAAAVETLVRFREHAERSGAERVIAVATSALRDASNRQELADRLERAVGAPIRFLSGEEEAVLTFSALHAGLGPLGGTVFGLDLGGGSLELVVGQRARPAWVKSLPLGAARLTGMFVRHDPIRPREREELQAHLHETLRPVAPEVRIRRPKTWVASGGSVKALARLIAADASRAKLSVHGVSVTGRQLRRVSDHLMRLRRSERARLPGVGRHRVDAIATGAEVLSTLTEVMGAHSLTVSEWGLRDGIILEALGLTETPSVGPWDRGALARSR